MDDMRQGTCAVCRHNEIIESIPSEQSEGGDDFLFAVRYRKILSVERWGTLHLYTCRRCGFAQWFAENPQNIPIDAKMQTRLITGPEASAPRR